MCVCVCVCMRVGMIYHGIVCMQICMYLADLVLELELTAEEEGAARFRVAPVVATGPACACCACACVYACARVWFECVAEEIEVAVDVDEEGGAVLPTADLDERVFQLAVLRSAMDYAAMGNGDSGAIHKSIGINR